MGKRRREMDDLFEKFNSLRVDFTGTKQTVDNLSAIVHQYINEGRKERDGLMETNHKLDSYKQRQEVFEDRVVGYMGNNDKKLDDISAVNSKFQKIIYITGSFLIAITALGALMSWASEMKPLVAGVIRATAVPITHSSPAPVVYSSPNKYTPREQTEYYELKLKHAKEKQLEEHRRLGGK